MPQPIAYNTGSQTSGSLKLNGIEYAISSSIVSGSNGQKWFTSVNPGNGIVLVTNSYTQSYSTYQNSTPLFYTASALTAAAITGAINGLPDRYGQVPFTTTASAFAWVANSRKYFMMNYEYPQIVTDGLILLNDAKFLASYPTTQSTWYDISGNNKNGSLINGPLFNSNQGAIVFDGINEIVNYGTGNTFFPLPSFSIELTFQSKGTVPTTGTSPGLFGFTFGIWTNFTSATNIRFGVSSGSTVATQVLNYTHTSNFRDDGKWYNIIFQATPTNSYIYLNGELKASRSVTWLGDTAYPTNGWNLGRDNNNVNQFFTGSISNFKMYNKALTQSEINQNYYGGPIVTDGLVFAVDAGNLVSYESGSLSTYSLTGSFTGSLDNGTSFNNINGGTFVFDGVDDFINIPINSAFNTPSVTFEVWANLQSINDRHILYVNWQGNSLEVNSTRSVVMYNFNSVGQQGAQTAGGVIQWDTWNHFVGTYDSGSQTLRTYVNGILLATRANTLATIYSVYVHKISGTNFGGEVKGNISIVRHYNRALSAQEIAQNFNAQRSRFGL